MCFCNIAFFLLTSLWKWTPLHGGSLCLLDPRVSWRFYKICLSVCLSVYPFTNFLRIGSLSFFIFCINVRFYELKLTELDFSRKFSLAQFQAKRTINCPENIFCMIWKILLLNISGKYIKWKTILLLIFPREPYIWQNSGSWDMGENAHNRSNYRFL